MASRHWLMGLAGLLALAGVCRSDPPGRLFHPADPPAAAPVFPLDALPPAVRGGVQAVLEKPSLTAVGKPESFNANANTYRWLLQHPELDVKLWRLVGAKAADVEVRDGVYCFHDGQGSEIFWRTAYSAEGVHVWFAEGKMKPALLLPASPFRAVVVMQYSHGKDVNGKPAVRHQVYFYLRCDSRAMALAARILGASAPHMAEQYLGQLEMFYGALAWYLYKDEARARRLFREIGLIVPEPAAAP
jgi:hypothetical protein